MTQLLPDDLAAVPIARITRAMKQLASGIKKSTMAAAVIAAHVYHLKRWAELKGCDSWAAWCALVDVSETYGNDLVRTAEYSAIADNVGQGRALLGLTQEQAQEVKAAAEERGPVTAKTLREERERIEAATPDDVRKGRAAVLGRAREVNRGATDEQVERRAPKMAEKFINLLRQHSATPEKHFRMLEEIRDDWKQQAELSRAA